MRSSTTTTRELRPVQIAARPHQVGLVYVASEQLNGQVNDFNTRFSVSEVYINVKMKIFSPI